MNKYTPNGIAPQYLRMVERAIVLNWFRNHSNLSPEAMTKIMMLADGNWDEAKRLAREGIL